MYTMLRIGISILSFLMAKAISLIEVAGFFLASFRK